MPAFSKIALFAPLIAYVSAQGVGTNTAETHPALTTYKCTGKGTSSLSNCASQATKIVLDANWRWVHGSGGYTNCYSGQSWNTALCPDSATCLKNCVLEGADYSGTYGITTSGNAVTLKFVTTNANGKNIGSRVYLMDTNDQYYQMFNLLGQEFTFDVDVSQLPCGLNGALYFSEMAKDGGLSKYSTNTAGAKYGTGYCDSQCPHDLKFIGGSANVAGWNPSSTDSNAGKGTLGACCNEMDIWEANSISTAYTPHPCSSVGLLACSSDQTCGDGNYGNQGTCDKAGCDFNSYRMGNTTFYGPSTSGTWTLDTTKKMTVVTQFVTSDGSSTGTLTEIRRFYVQNGVVFANSNANWPGVTGNSITDAFCAAQKSEFQDTNYFGTLGGLKTMGQSFGRGMVLVMSLWDDHAVDLLWLDAPYPTTADPSSPGITRGTCSDSSGDPTTLESTVPNASVTYSNIRTGPFGSTFYDPNGVASGSSPSGSGGSSGTAKTTTPVATTPVKTTTPVATTTPVKTTTAVITTTPVKTTAVTTTKSTTTSAAPAGGASHYAQCGGNGWTGATSCTSPYTCKVLNAYYSQCL